MTVLLQVGPLAAHEAAFLRAQGYQILTEKTIQRSQLKEVEAMYGWSESLGEQILKARASKLRWVQNIGAGINNLPIQALLERQIMVTNASGDKVLPIAQTVLGYLLYAGRAFSQYSRLQHWAPIEAQYLLEEWPVMIFGTGQIGQQLAAYLQAFHVPLIGVNTSGHPVKGFDKVCALADYQKNYQNIRAVISLLPGTPETYHLFDATFFDQQPLDLFINVGRGSTVNEADLAEKLKSGQVGQACLDVTEREPLPAESPLWGLENVLLTQHTSWAEAGYGRRGGRLFDIIKPNFAAFAAGRPLTVNLVDLVRGY